MLVCLAICLLNSLFGVFCFCCFFAFGWVYGIMHICSALPFACLICSIIAKQVPRLILF